MSRTERAAVPTIDGLPLVGNAIQMTRDPWGFAERLSAQGDVVRCRFLTREVYHVDHPEAVRRILVAESDRFRKSDLLSDGLADVAPTSIIGAEDEQWERLRSVLRPAFTARTVQSFADEIVAATADRVSTWRDGQRIDVLDESRSLTATTIGRTLFGDEYPPMADATADLVAAMDDRFTAPALFVPSWVPTPTNRRFGAAIEGFDAALDEAIESKRADRDGFDAATGSPATEGPEAPADLDVLDLLLDAAEDGRLSDRELTDQLFTLLFAGHGNVSVALSYALFSLARRPDAQASLQEEVDALDADPGVGSLGALPYTESVVDETLRLYPPAHELWRTPIEPVRLRGYDVPEGADVMLPVYTIHRDDRWWDDPDSFRPERWEGNDGPGHEFAYLPFGAGPRACLGRRMAVLQLRLALATIARRFAVDLAPGQSTDLDLQPSTTLSPSEPIELLVRER